MKPDYHTQQRRAWINERIRLNLKRAKPKRERLTERLRRSFMWNAPGGGSME